MVKKRFLILRWFRMAVLMFLPVSLVSGACSLAASGPGTAPKRKFIHPEFVQAQLVERTWRFETVFSPHRFQFQGQDWLAVNSKGRPALAYGGSQLNFAWFDGTAWQVETIDPRPGAGKFAHLLFDANDQPHILYATGAWPNLSLDHMYRDLQGWRQQTIDPNFCFGQGLDALFDRQGDLTVVYGASPSCVYSSIYETHIRLARQTQNGWEISLLSSPGSHPSLAIAPDGKLHVGYLDIAGNAMVVFLRHPDGTWQEQSSTQVGDFLYASDLLIDADLRPHFLTCPHAENSGGFACMLNHTWLVENGWQTEPVGFPGRIGVPPPIVMDSAGRIYALGGEKRPILLRRDADGWQELRTMDEESGYYPGLSLLLDRDEQIHAAYIKLPDYTVHYATQQDYGWQTQVVDQGNELYVSDMLAAMAYDGRGQLHIGYYDVRHNVHYLSKGPAGWRDEVVAQLPFSSSPRVTDLIFDPDNKPHIFYKYIKTTITGSHEQLVHAFLQHASWVNEEVPYNLNDDAYERSAIAIGPDGQPGFVEVYYGDTSFLHRTAQGWRVDLLEDIRAREKPLPQIVFPEEPLATSEPVGSLPSIFYFDRENNVLKFSAPGQSRPLVVPILDQEDQPTRLAMRQTGSRSGVYVVAYGTKSDGDAGVSHGRFRYAIYQHGTWQVYESSELYTPALSNQLIGPDGSVHIAFIDDTQEDWPVYYLEGRASAWKKTEVTGHNTWPRETYMAGMALDTNGEFCLLWLDLRSNSLVLGCLESISQPTFSLAN
jgi:hypothetical protein